MGGGGWVIIEMRILWELHPWHCESKPIPRNAQEKLLVVMMLSERTISGNYDDDDHVDDDDKNDDHIDVMWSGLK